MKALLFLLVLSWIMQLTCSAALVLKVGPTKATGNKVIVKLELQNTYAEKIQSVRAAIFLINEQGKVVGQSKAWIIGGDKDKPALAPATKTTFNFVIASDKPFSKSKIMVERILLENGQAANFLKDVQIIESP